MTPCIPHELDGFTLRRVWRGATYEITVDNAAHVEKGVKVMTVDGQPVSGNVLTPRTRRQHGAGEYHDGLIIDFWTSFWYS